MNLKPLPFLGRPQQPQRAQRALIPRASLLAVLAGLAVLTAAPVAQAQAVPQADEIARCLSDNTTGKDRKVLARWLFLSMATHPEVNELAKPSEQAVDEAAQAMGTLLTRLISQSCVREFQAVAKQQGAQAAIGIGFQNLGQLAMMEMMGNREVSATVSRFSRYIDKQKLDAVLEAR